MSFRRRTVLLAAGAVAVAVVIASIVVYFVTRGQLLGQLDRTLREKPATVEFVTGPNGAVSESGSAVGLPRLGLQARGGGIVAAAPAPALSGSQSERVTMPVKQPKGAKTETVTIERRTVKLPRGTLAGKPPPPDAREMLALPRQSLGGATGYVQLVTATGSLLHSESRGTLLPVTPATRAVAAGRRPAFFSDVTIAGAPVRMFTEAAGKGGVWQAALPLGDVNSTLSRLRLVLGLVCLGGVGLAIALGLLVSRAALAPVRRLRGAAESVARTQDLGHRIEARGDDDLGRLAESFNTMLAALERSRLAQRQLVSDASHELRTPITSVQANLDALALGERLPPRERARIVAAVQAQLGELTVLIGDLVDLSKTEVDELEVEDVRLDLAVAVAVRRARLHAPGCEFVLDAAPCLVRAAPARLDRAIANLLDNACQWGARAPIEIRVRDGVLEVRDRGPGFAAEDLSRVFDRFYRAPAARARPGAGLGLAIVRQMAESHGGSVHASNVPGGGARLTLELALVPMTDAELRDCSPAHV